MNQSLDSNHAFQCHTSSSLLLATSAVLWIVTLLVALMNILFYSILLKSQFIDADVRSCLRTMTIGIILSMLTKIIAVPYDIITKTTTNGDIPSGMLVLCSLTQMAYLIGYLVKLCSFAVLVVARMVSTAKQTYNETNNPNVIITRALVVGFFLSFLLPVVNVLRMHSDDLTKDPTCFCFISQLNLHSSLVYVASITVCETLFLLFFLVAHLLTKRKMLELKKQSIQQTTTTLLPIQTNLITSRMLLFCAIVYASAAWLMLLPLVISASSHMDSSSDSESLILNIILIVSAVSQCGAPIIAICAHKQLRTTAHQSVTNLLKRWTHRESKTTMESEDNKRGAVLGVVVDSDSSPSSSTQRKTTLVPAAPTTGRQQRRNSTLTFKDDHSAHPAHQNGDKLPPLPAAQSSSIQNDQETQQMNLFWQQTAKWGYFSGLEFSLGPANDGKIRQRQESVLVLPKIEPKPVVRKSEQMPSID